MTFPPISPELAAALDKAISEATTPPDLLEAAYHGLVVLAPRQKTDDKQTHDSERA